MVFVSKDVAFLAACSTTSGTGILLAISEVAFLAVWNTVCGAYKSVAPTAPVMGDVKFFAVPSIAFGAEKIKFDTGFSRTGEVKFFVKMGLVTSFVAFFAVWYTNL